MKVETYQESVVRISKSDPLRLPLCDEPSAEYFLRCCQVSAGVDNAEVIFTALPKSDSAVYSTKLHCCCDLKHIKVALAVLHFKHPMQNSDK